MKKDVDINEAVEGILKFFDVKKMPDANGFFRLEKCGSNIYEEILFFHKGGWRFASYDEVLAYCIDSRYIFWMNPANIYMSRQIGRTYYDVFSKSMANPFYGCKSAEEIMITYDLNCNKMKELNDEI